MIAALVASVDRARLEVLRSLVPLSSVLAADRELRVAVIASIAIAMCFVLAVGAPFWVLALGPIVLGVPHLLADVRYCVVRPGWHRRMPLVVAAGGPLLIGSLVGEPSIAFAGIVGAAAAANGASWRRGVVVAIAAAGIAALTFARGPSQLVLVHLHNVVAIGLWWAWRRRTTSLHRLPLVLIVLFAAAIGSIAPATGIIASAPAALGLPQHLRQLAPGASIDIGARIVMLFCFAQAVHYVIWLRLVPEEDRDRSTPRSFGQSLRALQRELGRPLLLVTAALALVLAIAALFDLAQARMSYLRFGMFHVTLELVAAALVFIEGRPTDRRHGEKATS